MRRLPGVLETLVRSARCRRRGPGRLASTLALGLLVLAGCSTTGNGNGGGGLGRPRVAPGVKTITSVGDRPSTVVAGLSGDSYSTDVELPSGRDRAQGRITGRVLDDRGRPVAGAQVRLADGTTPFGRNVGTVTDDSGAFTLRELRPGTRYTLIAEVGDGGRTQLGRAVAEAPESEVRIRLARSTRTAADDDQDRIDRVSNRRSLDDEFESDDPPAPRPRPRVNPADLPDDRDEPLEARDRDRDRSESEPPRRSNRPPADDPVPVPRTRPASSGRRSADPWRPVGPDAEPASSRAGRVDLPDPDRNRSAYGLPYDAEDGENPLPPARERSEIERSPSGRDSDLPEGAVPVSSRPRSRGPASGETFTSGDPALARSGSGGRRGGGGDTIETFTAAPSIPVETFVAATAAESEPEPEPGAIGRVPPRVALAAPAERSSAPAGDVPALDEASEAPARTPKRRGPQSAETFESAPAPGTAAAEPAPAPAAPAEPARAPLSDPAGEPPAIVAPVDPSGIPPDVLGPAASNGGPRPSWKDLTAQSASARPKSFGPSTRRLTAATPSTDRQLATASTRGPDADAGTPARTGLGLVARSDAATAPAAPRDASVAPVSARFDGSHKRLVDFQLPDLQGQPVRFQDLDADLILLDFWGTWCSPCLRAVPRLVELQDRYDPKQLQVVGIAYETQPSHDGRARAVEQTMRRLGVNYPILIGPADGQNCPLQSALNVKAYPTLILLDRSGRILWRDTGGDPSILERLDRVIAAQTGGLARDEHPMARNPSPPVRDTQRR